jgi:hypothetical protein
MGFIFKLGEIVLNVCNLVLINKTLKFMKPVIRLTYSKYKQTLFTD